MNVAEAARLVRVVALGRSAGSIVLVDAIGVLRLRARSGRVRAFYKLSSTLQVVESPRSREGCDDDHISRAAGCGVGVSLPPERRRHGALKTAVADRLLHATAPLSAQELRQQFEPAQRPALTTLLTILDRMYRAGELDRVRRPTGEYEFSVARREASAAAEAMIDSLLAARDRSTALLSFAGSLSPDDVETLKRALERKPSRRAP